VVISHFEEAVVVAKTSTDYLVWWIYAAYW